MHPGRLTRVPLLKIYLRRYFKKSLKQKILILKNFVHNNEIDSDRETLLGTGKNIEINGNWANLSLRLPEIKDTVDSVHFQVNKKSLSMIIPAKPIHSNEKAKKIIPAFRPSGAILNNYDN